ncbi:MAG: MFS transporter, partial [Bacteroidota bacterium]
LVISQLGTFIAWVLFLLAFLLPKTTLWGQDTEITGNYTMTLPLLIIFLARIFDGFTGGNVSVANAYLSDISTDEDRNANFGKMGASTSLGFVLGPAVAGVLASTIMGEALPLLLAAVISLIAIFVINTRLEETVPCVVNTGKSKLGAFRRFFQVEHKNCFEEGELAANPPKRGWKAVLQQPGIPLLYAVYFLTFLAFSLFYAGLPIYANTLLDWTATDLGIFLAYSSFIMILVQGPLLSRLSKKLSNRTLIILGSLFLALGFFLLGLDNTLLLYLANTLFSVGNGLMWPSFLALLSATGEKHMQGAIQGYGNSMGSFASMLGLVIGGMLFESIAVTVFGIGAAIFLLITLLMGINSLRSRRPKPGAEGVLTG